MSSQRNDSIKLSTNFEISTEMKVYVDTPDIMVKY